MKYRSEIDGLRAVAVVPVIFFHAGASIFSGGFVGVDVFFVISGYLITLVILEELKAGRFSILNFYERRARRILPALFTVIVSCIPFAWVWMTPAQLEKFSESILATVLFLSNFYFWRDSGYFAAVAEEKPLLHTWSLAVEEQFYLLFPLLLYLVWRGKGRSAIWWISLLAIGSLALSEWGWRTDPVKNFLFTGSRIWELLVGSLCAIYTLKNAPNPGGFLSAFGLGLILFAMLVFDTDTPFPSLYTLVPVMGAALILLFADRNTLVGSVLSMKLVVMVGLISYSAYLWHQPIFAFARVYSIADPTNLTMGALAILVFPLAYLSWRFIEQPMRRRDGAIGRRGVFALSGIGMICLFSIGLYGDKSDGFPDRLSPEVLAFYQDSKWHKNCLYRNRDSIPSLPNASCIYNKGGTYRVAIFGDSIAASLTQEVALSLKELNVEVHQLSHGNCMPVVGLVRSSVNGFNPCPVRARNVASFIKSEGFDAVILAANWAAYLEGPNVFTDDAGASADFQSAFANMISGFDAPTILILPHAVAPYEVADAAIRTYQRTGVNPELGIDVDEFKSITHNTSELLSSAVLATKIEAVDPKELFCNIQIPNQCAFSSGGSAFLSDKVHYTSFGARYVANALVPLIENILKPEMSR